MLEPTLSSHRARTDLADLNGILVVDKPIGITSHDVVSRIRRMTGMKRIGHGGTLDPFASGVLIVAAGRSTRVLQYVQSSNKSYVVDLVLGVTTDSGDIDGTIVERHAIGIWPDRQDIDRELMQFIGDVQQIPPAHSAIKVGGRKLYELARSGETVNAPVRQVTIHSIDVLEYRPPDLRLFVRCGKGTYIRSIARDLGNALSTGAYCHGLRRVTNGGFCISECWTLDELATLDVRERWPYVARHPDAALIHLKASILGPSDAASWYHGRPIRIASSRIRAVAEPVRVYDDVGNFLGIGSAEEQGFIRPTLVMPSNAGDQYA